MPGIVDTCSIGCCDLANIYFSAARGGAEKKYMAV